MKVRLHRLDNGLRVYLSPNPEEPRIAARVAVRSGAAQDPHDATGTAHLLEHMLANKGSTRLGALDHEAEKPLLERIDSLYEQLHAQPQNPELVAAIDTLSQQAARHAVPNELKQAYGRVGARSFNAYTSHDRSTYVVDIPPEALGVWAALETDRFRHPVLRGYQTEVETVREEKRRGMDDPGRAVREAMAELLWPGHPYARPILGQVEHLDAPRPRVLRDWFERWYVPSNMALVLAGDLDPDRTLELIERHFGEWRRDPPPRWQPHEGTGPSGEVRVELNHHGSPTVMMGWRTVPRGHPDEAALSVADMLLCNGATGLLDELQHETTLRRAWSSPSFRAYGGMLVVGGSPREGQDLDEVEALLLQAVERLQRGELNPERVQAIIQAWRIGELKGLERNSWRAGRLVEAFVFDEPWEYVRKRTDRRAEVPLEQVFEAARRWLGTDRAVVSRRTGEPTLPLLGARKLSTRTHKEGLNSPFLTEVIAEKAPQEARPALVEGVDYHLRHPEEERGALVIRVDNPYSELAALSFRLGVGQESDPVLASALAYWDHCGHRGGKLADWEGWLYRLGGSVELGVARWTTRFGLSGPRKQIGPLLEGLLERLQRPTSSPEQLQRWLDDLVQQREQSKTLKKVRNAALRSYAAYEQASPWLAEPSTQALRSLDEPSWLQRASRLSTIQADVLAVGLEDIPAWPGKLASPERAPRRLHRPPHDRVLLLQHSGAQAQVTVLTWQEDYQPHRVPLYKVLGEVLGANAGLIFQQIREARGLAYSAHARLDRGGLPGDDNLLMAQIGTRPEQAAEAASLARGILRTCPIDHLAFERGRHNALTRLKAEHTNFRRIPTSVLSWHKRGLRADPRPGWIQGLQDLTHDSFLQWTDSWSEQPFTIAILGDLERMDRAALETLGELVTLDFSAISAR